MGSEGLRVICTEHAEIEARYKAIIDTAVDAIITIDEAGSIETFNPSAEQMFGYGVTEVVGHDISILMPESVAENHDKLIRSYLTGSKSKVIGFGREILAKRKDGSLFPILISVSDAVVNGKRFFTGIIHDNTERRNLLDKLQENEDRFLKSQRFANIGIWDWNIVTNELYWSEKVPFLIGCEPGKYEVKFETFIEAVHPDDREKVMQAIDDCINYNLEYDIEHRVILPDGSEHWIKETGDIVRDENDRPIRMIGVAQDVTNRKQAELKSLKNEIKAREANKAKSQFLSSMSHELRTPLNAILGYTQLLQLESTLDTDQLEMLTCINYSSKHLLDLINEILDLAKIEAGNLTVNIDYLDAASTLEESLLLAMPLAETNNISLLYDLSELENIYIYADRTRFNQVMLNLISNAIKYNKENGQVIVTFAEVNNKFRINIRDTGNGIPLDQHAFVFEPFNRLGAEQSQIEGSGIGLAITKQLIELQNGSIGFDTIEGKGTTFWIEFPFGKGMKHSAAVKRTQEMRSNLNAFGTTKKTVLYIEDNNSNLKLMRTILSKKGYIELLEAKTAETGLNVARHKKPDLILMDINLPGMNGLEALQQIKRYDDLKNTPIIAVSADATTGSIQKGLASGFNEYITKPIDLNNFYYLLNKYLHEQ